MVARGTTPAWLLVAFLVLVVAALHRAWPRRMVMVHSSVTNKSYAVRNEEPGANQVAADRLAALDLRVRDFLAKAEAYAPGDARLRNIRRRWDGALAEIPDDAEVAHSIGKGAVSVCVRTGIDTTDEAVNSGMFVMMHELAHVATDTYGHTPEFWANMRFLLELAEAVGAYSYQDFQARTVAYCGRRLSASPLDCVKSRSCDSLLPRRAPA